MKINNLPFHIGPTTEGNNPSGLPDVYAYQLGVDQDLNLLCQVTNNGLIQLLQKTYTLGQNFGTPLADDQFGKPTADDFLLFIEKIIRTPKRGLEIGAGVGYLTRCLIDKNWDMTALEPGHAYAPYWEKYQVKVIQDYFPSLHASGPFDLVCAFGVLEHVFNPTSFLKDVKKHLTDDGLAIFAVPDCTDEILAGDPSILFHEHISCFDAGSLARVIQSAGLYANVTKSGYGRCLYAVASNREIFVSGVELGLEKKVIATYPDRCAAFVDRVRAKIAAMRSQGTLGVYCAARGFALLDPSWDMRFFDDDPALHGKYLPPFQVPIASRQELEASPVDNLIILSRTFGSRIRGNLVDHGYKGKIITLDEL